MNRLKKRVIYTLIFSMLLSNTTPAFGYTYKDSIVDVEYTDTTENGTSNTTVYAEVGSSFKVTIPKHIILDGTNKSGKYMVGVKGDIAGTEIIKIKPDNSFVLKSDNLKDVTASIAQDKTSWGYDEILEGSAVIGNGAIDATEITAGSWNGSFNFNVKLTDVSVTVKAENSDGIDLNANAENIIDDKKDVLLDKLGETDLIEDISDIDAIIEIESDDFENLAKTVFNVSNIAKPGDKVVILHFDEETNEWEYISTEIVADDGTITVYMDSYSPVAFFKVEDKLEHKHSYIESTKESTCTQLGEKIFTCECGDTYTEEIAVLGHDYKAVITNSTCTEKGYTTYTCSRCNDTYTDEETNANGHTYSKWEEIESANCIKAGLKQRTCTICGYIETEETTALGHGWEEKYTTDKAPTCTTDGSKSIHCANCDVTKDITVIPATGHTEIAGGTKDIHTKCSVCNKTLSNAHILVESISKEATCTEKGKTKYSCECGYSYELENIAALGHNYKQTITNPTCTEKGYTTNACSKCNDTYTDSVVAATGHDYNLTITDATCTTNGNKHYECKNCNSKYDEAISATGHVYDATKYVTDKAATCTEAGSKSVHCNVCKAIITSTVTTIPATGHSYSTTYTTDKAATCSAEGSKSQHCTRSGCSAKQNVTTIAKLAHTNVNGGTSEIHTKCSVCGATTSSTHSYTVDSGVQYKAATCTANRQNYKRCSCGYNPKSASYIVAVANTATGHTYGTPTYSWNGTTTCAAQRVCSKCQVVQAENATITNAVTKAATCTEAGVRTYTAKFTNTAFAAQTKTASIAATGHTQVNGGTSGVHTKCSVCGITTSTAHSYTTTITKPWTCAGDGAKKHTCSCGYSYTETVPATGHSYGAGVLVGQMTGYTAWDGGVWFEYTTYASNVEMTAAICGSCPSHYYYIYPTNYAGDWYGTRTKMSYVGIANSLYHYRYNQYLSSAGKYYFLFWEDCDSLANTSQYWTSVVTRYSCTKCGNYYDVKDRT